jgi:hypothetical protein
VLLYNKQFLIFNFIQCYAEILKVYFTGYYLRIRKMLNDFYNLKQQQQMGRTCRNPCLLQPGIKAGTYNKKVVGKVEFQMKLHGKQPQ